MPGQDACPGEDGRITHACLNKDKALIEPGGGVVVNGVTVTGLGNVSDPQTPRGQVGQNALKAVAGAVIESRRQWDDFRLALVARYGQQKAKLMIVALTKDIPTGGLPVIPDVPFIPAIPGVPGQGNPAGPPSLPNLRGIPGLPGLPGLPGVPKP